MAKVLKTRRLQSGDFVHINNSSAPGLLEKVAVLGDYGYTPTKQSAVPDGVVANPANRIMGVGRESQQQSSDPLWNAKPHGSQAGFIRPWKKQRRGRPSYALYALPQVPT